MMINGYRFIGFTLFQRCSRVFLFFPVCISFPQVEFPYSETLHLCNNTNPLSLISCPAITKGLLAAYIPSLYILCSHALQYDAVHSPPVLKLVIGGVFHRGFPLLSQSLAAAICHTTSKDYCIVMAYFHPCTRPRFLILFDWRTAT